MLLPVKITAQSCDPSYNEEENSSSTADINIDCENITRTSSLTHGIQGFHQGSGNIDITTTGSSISTEDPGGYIGIHGLHQGTGNIDITTTGSSISTEVQGANGIHGTHEGIGNLNINTTGGSISTDDAIGIYANHSGNGNLNIETDGVKIKTDGIGAYGIYGQHSGTGSYNFNIETIRGSITTSGTDAYGIFGLNTGNLDLNIETDGVKINTTGRNAWGIRGDNDGGDNEDKANLRIVTTGGSITTSGYRARGILGQHRGTGGNINIEASGGSITTEGEWAHGIFGYIAHAENEGELRITTKDGHTITTDGDNAYGIYVSNNGQGRSEVEVANIEAKGVGAHGIRFGWVTGGFNSFIPPVDEDGYRKQTARINGKVMGGSGAGAGVFMQGGGRVIIGPEGTLGSKSNIAVYAVGIDETPIQRKLYVNLLSMDGKPWERLEGRFINVGDDSEAETILAVNGENLYKNDRLDVWATSGLYEVQLNPDEDFSELDFSEEDDWISRFHPRVGVYEALPGAVRRIDAVPCRVATDQHFIGLCGGRGKYLPAQTNAGMSYTYDQGALHAHMMVPLNDRFSGWAGIRKVSGEAKVTMAAGPGNLKVQGLGLYGGLQFVEDNDFYGQADFTGSRYDLDLSAKGGSGSASSTTEGEALVIGLEAGHHFTLNDRTQLTGRGWLNRSEVSIEPFEDALTGRPVSAEDTQAKLGLGVMVERNIELDSETNHLVLRGGLGLEKVISADSYAKVGEDSFQTVAKENRILLDLGGVFHRGDTEIHGDVYAHGLGSDDTAFGLNLGMNWSF